MRIARFAAVLAVMLVIGVAGIAWGSDGQPLILGEGNTATRLTELHGDFEVGTGLPGSTSLTATNDTIFNGWVTMGTGLRFVTGEHTGAGGGTIGRAVFRQGTLCRFIAGAATPRPTDNRSIPMVFTGMVGIHPGLFVSGTQTSSTGLRICLNRPAPSTVKVNWLDVDFDNAE